jgi:dipeptidyl aminopeptidase/acylaminoacyl peptidase
MLEIGSVKANNLTEGNEAPDLRPLFSPDGRLLAYAQQNIAGFYGDQSKLMVRDIESGKIRALHADWDRSADFQAWSPDSKGLYGSIDDAATLRLYFIPLNNSDPVPLTADTDYDQLSISSGGVLVARNQSFVYPPRVVRIDKQKKTSKRLEAFNDVALKDVAMGTYESVTYTGGDGAEVLMWVHYPPGFDPLKKYPLFLLIHGGPHGAMTNGFHFRWNAQTFSSWGYITAWPNFHGSSGFGQDFTDSINPDWITLPYADTIAATEWLMQKPWIDTERMVAGGGSYGGYLSSIILGKKHPFNALVIHAAVYDMYAQSSADFAVHDERFGPYWENPDLYNSISPHVYAGNFNTPSLVIHGQLDLRVPVGQGFELFRTLQTRGIASNLVYYPDENHWVLKRDNSIYWYGEVRNWVEKYATPGPLESMATAD